MVIICVLHLNWFSPDFPLWVKSCMRLVSTTSTQLLCCEVYLCGFRIANWCHRIEGQIWHVLRSFHSLTFEWKSWYLHIEMRYIHCFVRWICSFVLFLIFFQIRCATLATGIFFRMWNWDWLVADLESRSTLVSKGWPGLTGFREFYPWVTRLPNVRNKRRRKRLASKENCRTGDEQHAIGTWKKEMVLG